MFRYFHDPSLLHMFSVINLQSLTPDDIVRGYFLRLDKDPPPSKTFYNHFHRLNSDHHDKSN